jgi:hypothetical protein
MRALQGIFPANLRGNPLLGLLMFAFALVGAYESATFILADDMIGLVYVGLGFIVGAFVIAMLNNWRRGLYIFLTWLLFEDLARKFLGNNMAIYFAKDFLVAVVYLAFFLAWRRKEVISFRPPFLFPVLLLVWLGFMQVFNSASPHILYGLMGMKLFFYYIPLLFVGYGLLDSERELRRFFMVNLALILVITALGIAQSILGPSFLTPTNLQEDIRGVSVLYRVAPVSGAVVFRATSVFVTTGRYVDFLYVSWLMALGFVGYTLLRYPKGRRRAFIAIIMLAGGIVLSSSRGAFAWSSIAIFVMVAAFLWGAPWRQGEVIRILRTIFRVSLAIALGMSLLMVTFPDALLGRLAVYSETIDPRSASSELMHRARDYPLRNFLGAFDYDRWPYGYGIGTTALGTQYVTRLVGVRPLGVGVESGFGALVIEMGILGLIFWLIMTVAILGSAWKIVKQVRGSPWFPIAFVIFWFTFLMLFPFMVGGIQAYEDFVLNSYFWLLLGVLFRLPHIRTRASAEDATAQTALLQSELPRMS